MTLKLALRNVRRSFRDYALYFITLALGVAMFYAFNSINDQAVLLDALSADSQRMLRLLDLLMRIFSIAVACTLAFLVVYANRFLLKRRRHEFGMYLMLGMGPGRMARILLVETTIVGAVALAVGLACGIALSQGLSFATAGLMGTTMSHYRFIVSGHAVVFTLVCFAAIFALSALVDVVYISRRKLSALLSTREGGGPAKAPKTALSCVAFAISLALIALAYRTLHISGMVEVDNRFILATVLMLAGTFLVFWSVTGFALACLQGSKAVRFKGLSMFTARQVSSKINTAFASMSVVCVLLFLATTTVATGMGMVELFVGNLKENTRYDASISTMYTFTTKNNDIEVYDQFFREKNPESAQRMDAYGIDPVSYIAERSQTWPTLVKDCAVIDTYLIDYTYGQLFEGCSDIPTLGSDETDRTLRSSHIEVMSVEQFNDARRLLGLAPVSLPDDRFIIDNTLSSWDDLASAICSQNASVEVFGRELTCQPQPMSCAISTSAIGDMAMGIVVPAWVVDRIAATGALPYSQCLDIMYTCDRLEGDQALARALSEALPIDPADVYDTELYGYDEVYRTDTWPVVNVYTAREMIDQASGLRMVITFLAVYIGFVLMMTTAAVLAIQQLSEVTDSLPRYRRLSTLGVDTGMTLRSLRIQTVTYFLAPLMLAASHTYCAVSVLNEAFLSELGVNISGSILFAAALVVGIYGLYTVVAYVLSRSMVKQAISR